jgi:hypothetical protein
MGSLVRRLAFLAVLAVVVVVCVGSAQGAVPHTRRICAPIHATGVGQDLGGGRTQATISSHGLVVGRTNASFTLGQVVGTTAPFSGPIVWTSALGTLTAQVVGTFDVATGAFRATSTSIAGTGLLRGVSGSVTLAGVEDFATLTFTETITGRLCVSPSRGA